MWILDGSDINIYLYIGYIERERALYIRSTFESISVIVGTKKSEF